MCGIVGFSGKIQAKQIIIDGLHSLEYRGYDSAGLSLACENEFKTVKCSGRVSSLEEMCKALELYSTCGIGHTRWATHGAPSSENAHPHESDSCVLVHNGIIENYMELRKKLSDEGYNFRSETDTECIVHLIDREYKKSLDPKIAIRNSISELKGSFAIAVMFKNRSGEIWGTKRDNPLIAAKNENGTYLASDIPALLPHSNEILRPEDDEIIYINNDDIFLYDKNDSVRPVLTDRIDWNVSTARKDGFEHFMLKEIYEQPKAILRTVSGVINEEGIPDLSAIGIESSILKNLDSVSIIGCGSATHAGLVGKFIIEQLAKIPVFVTTASEYRYSPPVTVGNSLTIAVSQSGETADTLAALRIAKKDGSKALGIINSVGSAIARESDYIIYTNAGPEIAVATTKGYTTQLTAFVIFAVSLALAKGEINKQTALEICNELKNSVPKAMEEIIARRQEIKDISASIYDNEDLYFIGRGPDNFAGIECSLKLKEISYIHSEAYAAGELKHGTLSLIEDGTPVVALACEERYYDKMLGNIREVISRGGRVVLVCGNDFQFKEENSFKYFTLPKVSGLLSPLISVVFAQLMAYEIAVLRGCDVDHPRNLAKSVTVE